jgi:ribosomal protein S11
LLTGKVVAEKARKYAAEHNIKSSSVAVATPSKKKVAATALSRLREATESLRNATEITPLLDKIERLIGKAAP